MVNISAMTTIDVIDGIKYPERKMVRPGNFLSIRSARKSAIIVVTGIVPITKIKVFFKDCKKAWSEKRATKF